MSKRGNNVVARGEMSEEESAAFTALEEQADRDADQAIAAAAVAKSQVNLRWSREQIDLIRRAAAVYGIPYQTYLKQAAIRQAVADLRSAREVGAVLA